MSGAVDRRLEFRAFAIVPAAGHSRRMGRPKLLLPWKGKTVIESVLAVWRASRIEHAVVVVRRDDRRLVDTCRQAGARVVTPPDDPPEMKDSVRVGLEFVDATFSPTAADVWLLAPADIPGLSSAVIDRLLREHDPGHPAILIPSVAGKRGHPVLFPWTMSNDVAKLPDNAGVNALLLDRPVREIAWSLPSLLDDLDTPSDYRRLIEQDNRAD